jgi:hypothetical protein
MLYESEMSRVTFLKRIKVHDVKLSQVDRPFGITLDLSILRNQVSASSEHRPAI